MALTRRGMIAASAGLAVSPALARLVEDDRRSLGLVIHSFPIRLAVDRARGVKDRFDEPARFLEHGRSLGVNAVQVRIGARDERYADALRERSETAGVALEGIVLLPGDESDLDRFEAEIRTASRAGARIVRTVLLSGRRYETFASEAQFRDFLERSRVALGRAAPVVARHGVRLAVENHKDCRADEQLDLLRSIDSDHIGICLDTGNSLALLEDPREFIEALAPLALTTHLKDMAVEEYEEGFLLSEVPLGTGVLDLPSVIRTLRRANPAIHFNLEMITRDPLKVPCLTERYWATFPDLPGRHLARILSFVRTHRPRTPLPRVSALPHDEQLRVEDENVRNSLGAARTSLGL